MLATLAQSGDITVMSRRKKNACLLQALIRKNCDFYVGILIICETDTPGTPRIIPEKAQSNFIAFLHNIT
ncbi:MAG: hypothetical protein MRK00_14015 [Nitrosomonas sp.]|nr:hypothetical protein [Nitrosomonas sp.]